MSIRVLLADDHTIVREGLRWIIERDEIIRVVGEANNGREAVELARECNPDVVVMDVAMPELNGMEATRQLLSDNPRLRIIALSAFTDRRYVLGMLDAGCRGFIPKADAGDELLRAIRAVAAGKVYLAAEVADTVVGGYTQQPVQPATSAGDLLGAREREVLQLVAEGLNSGQIADRLDIATSTVDTHRRNIMKKLDLHSVAELTKYALREGLTNLDT